MTRILPWGLRSRRRLRRSAAGAVAALAVAASVGLAPAADSASVPDAPTNVSATAGNASATVSWSAPADNGSVITSYTVTPFIGAIAQTTTVVIGTPPATSTQVTGLTSGTTYTFVVFATNAFGPGLDSAPSNAVTIPTVPGAPTIVSATAGNASATVTWSAPADGGSPITSYTVTPFIGATAQPITVVSGAPPATSTQVTGLTNGTTYTFVVFATNAIGPGLDSAPSSPVTPEPTAPGAPTNVSATAGIASATVSWSAPADNGSVITSYTVTPFIGATAQTTTMVTGAPPVTSTKVTGLTNGTTYTFKVTAANAFGPGPISTASNAVTTPTVPGIPTNVSATAGNASATVSWSAPADGGSVITSYTVTPFIGATAQATTVVSGAPPATSTQVTGLTNGTAYTFVVFATNAVGPGLDSVPSSPVTPEPTVPGAPTNVSAVAGIASATVSWSAPADNGSVITSYTVTPFIGATAQATTVVSGTPPGTSTQVTGLTNGTTYTFKVAATNAVGTGPISPASNAVTTPTPPSAPTIVSVTAGNASATVTWSAPADGGSPITSYTVTPFIGATAQATTVVSGAPPATSTQVTGLTNGTTYTFKVAATNAVGTGPSSPASAGVTPLGPPGAPTGVSGTPGDASVSLSWTAPADTGGTPVTSYTIAVTGTNAPAPIVTGTTATSRVVTGLTNGASYTFMVAATNAVGTGPNSPVSVAVVPRTVPGAPTGVAAAPANASAIVVWSAPADNGGAAITAYIVTTHGPAPLPLPITVNVPATGAAIGGLTNGVSYTFTVAAVNVAGAGADSTPSNAVVPLTVPTQPTSVSAKAGDGSAKVSWSPPADSGGSAISAYTVMVKLAGTEVTHVVVDGSTTTATVGGLTNGTTYSVTVSAANSSGPGPASFPVAVTPDAPIVVKRASTATGYWMLGTDGMVYAFGQASHDLGNPTTQLGSAQAVDIEATPSGGGYWILASDGRVFAYGDAAGPFVSNVNPNALDPGERVTSLSATPSGAGYWVFTSKGRAINFGNAHLFGDMSRVTLNGPVLDSVATPSGNGYYMVASDGGIFAFGDAHFAGSMGSTPLNAPVESLVPDSDGEGYWLVAADGGIFAFDAPFRGSMGGVRLNRPVTGMIRFGDGYLMVAADGGIFDFSDQQFLGSLGSNPPLNPITAVAAVQV